MLACGVLDAKPALIPQSREILRLARQDKRAAEDAVASLSLAEQVLVV